MEGCSLGGASGHIKALPFPHQRKIDIEGLLEGHALCMPLPLLTDTFLHVLPMFAQNLLDDDTIKKWENE